MKYFIDTEFFEDFHKPLFGKKRHFIDLISIGIVAEDGREYYAISKDFDLKTVWNKYDTDPEHKRNYPPKKDYWLRDNVLKPIFTEQVKVWARDEMRANRFSTTVNYNPNISFTCRNFKKIIKRFGKYNKQIAKEIIQFVYADVFKNFSGAEKEFHARTKEYGWNIDSPIEFYGYYSAYDHVLLSSLFGRMIDLPTGFPMYMRDLKQMLDEKVEKEILMCHDCQTEYYLNNYDGRHITKEGISSALKSRGNYPKQENEHSSICDARWNRKLYEFLNTL
ncbi:MAG TPA: hypothetical protein VIQ00_05365 [Chitinophagaceae bacterium]